MLKWTRQKGSDKPSTRERPAAAQRAVRTAQPGAVADKAPALPASLSQLLLREGKATQAQMDSALAKQRETGAFLGEILIEEQVLDEQSLISFLAKHCRIPHLSLLDYLIEPKILKLVPREICLKYRLLPIDQLGRNLTLAMVNPLDREALDAVRAVCPDLRIKPILCAFKHFDIVTKRLYETEEDRKEAPLSATSFGLKTIKAASAPEAPPKAEPVPAPTEEQARQAEEAPDTPPPPLPTPPPPPPPPPVGLPEDEGAVERDALIDNVFAGDRKEDDGASSSLMNEVTNVMVNSMRDTYEILARRMELFRGVGPEDVAKIFSRGITTEYEAGKVIFEAGDPGDQLYVILGGEILIHDGDREIARLNRGDMFGEMALAENAPRSAGARALTDASLLALSWDVINHVIPPEVSLKLLVNILITLSDRLRRANRQ